MMGKFIVIEGMDGSGKTTISKLLSENIGAISYKTPPEKFSKIRRAVNNCDNIYANFFYYLSGNYFAAEEIEKYILEGKSVVCDRYYYTTLSAYHDLRINSLFRNEEELINTLYQPDFSFFLSISEDERASRIKKRRNATPDDIESVQESVSRKQIKKYHEMGMIMVDTNGLTPEQVVDYIVNKINCKKLSVHDNLEIHD